MELRVYNTLTRKKEEFTSREPGQVGMYVCGPTTYNYIHLGNARPIVVFDTIRRYLEYQGYQVQYIQNFTDIDDKIINRAREEGEEPNQLAQQYIDEYFRDADALNVRRAQVHPRVSEHLPEILALVTQLLAKNCAYQVGSDVYFAVEQFAEYGKLSGRDLADLQAGARVEVNEQKRNPLDFALWKGAKPGEPAWPSPWGPGRPGWHIECSAMALRYLGSSLDIHGGGSDLIFPHHENELAQSEAASGKSFCRYWLHNGFITINQEKMSKSLGNFFLVRDILQQFSPQVIRFYLLSTHYRSPLDFDDGKLTMNQRSLERLRTCWDLTAEFLVRVSAADKTAQQRETSSAAGEALEQQRKQSQKDFVAAMNDDFNTALAIAALFDLTREINTLRSYLEQQVLSSSVSGCIASEWAALERGQKTLGELLGVLGLEPEFLHRPVVSEEKATEKSIQEFESLINFLKDLRAAARTQKKWAQADQIRDGLSQAGIQLEDTPTGVRVHQNEGVQPINGLVELLMEIRNTARQEKEWALADQIREGLSQRGIRLDDTPQGTRWQRGD